MTEPGTRMGRTRRILTALVALPSAAVVLGVVVLLAVSEWKLRRTHQAPLTPFDNPPGSTDPAEGERLSKIVGCWAGCHGKTGQGGAIDMDGYYSVTAPTLASVLPLYDDAELARLVRFGVKRDGTSALGMISYTFFPLSDGDLSNIVAHLRRQPPQQAVPRHRSITLAARIQLALGRWQLAADQVDAARPRWGELRRATAFERGRYLASITCSECHGVDFRGNEFADNTFDGGPSLAVIAMYGPEEFRHLLRAGEAPGGRGLGEMGWVARNAFVYFQDREIDDIYTFLREYHGLPPAPSH